MKGAGSQLRSSRSAYIKPLRELCRSRRPCSADATMIAVPPSGTAAHQDRLSWIRQGIYQVELRPLEQVAPLPAHPSCLVFIGSL